MLLPFAKLTLPYYEILTFASPYLSSSLPYNDFTQFTCSHIAYQVMQEWIIYFDCCNTRIDGLLSVVSLVRVHSNALGANLITVAGIDTSL